MKEFKQIPDVVDNCFLATNIAFNDHIGNDLWHKHDGGIMGKVEEKHSKAN